MTPHPDDARLLDDTLLKQFDEVLGSLGAPISRAWRPGLSEAQIDALLQPADLDLPEEARTWWRWHDGAEAVGGSALSRVIGTREVYTLAEVAEDYMELRGEVEDVYRLTALLLPVGEKPQFYFNCGGHRDDPVPVYLQNDIETPAPRWPSIGAWLFEWIEVLEAGTWSVTANGEWRNVRPAPWPWP